MCVCVHNCVLALLFAHFDIGVNVLVLVCVCVGVAFDDVCVLMCVGLCVVVPVNVRVC